MYFTGELYMYCMHIYIGTAEPLAKDHPKETFSPKYWSAVTNYSSKLLLDVCDTHGYGSRSQGENRLQSS